MALPTLVTKVDKLKPYNVPSKDSGGTFELVNLLDLASAIRWSVCMLHWLYGRAAACRTVSDIIPKEKSNGLPVFTQALRLVPFSMPDHWSGPRLCEDLPGQYIWL